MRFLLGAMVGILVQFLWSPIPAYADPMCNFSHSCSWAPSYNGPMQQEQDTPGTYGGVTSNPVWCDPFSGACRVVVPGQ